ncbi:hypothetical protein BGZ96_006505 [Linnemannia gamsii]|uniref:Mitochondrial import inner membrane translocase subunit TIM50 n=1 Tax=Linnemannia gamsii TaxID=64522 RepID=A0ABQ7K2U6_9FUNG|nr:hypothetical protein BGZ96_006505 [Linnemannia gamsii]
MNKNTTTVIDENRYYDEAKKIFYPLTGIRPLTTGYMDLANQPPMKLDTPKKLLVILDLNGTLFYSSGQHYKTRSYIKRPYFVPLLLFLYANCRVMIWSSATRQRVNGMLTGGGFTGVEKIDRVWNREHLQLRSKDLYRKVLTLKDLEFVWSAIEAERAEANPEQLLEGGKYEFRYDQTNTVLIDDSSHKTQLQPHNCMIVPDFDSTRVQCGDDQELLKVIHYLSDLLYQDNVSAYMRTSPFNTNSAFYLSQEFHTKAAVWTNTPKNLKAMERKRERKKVALEKARAAKSAENTMAQKHKWTQEERKSARRVREVEMARKTEMTRKTEMSTVARIGEVAGLHLESPTAILPTSSDWTVPDWSQQLGFEDINKDGEKGSEKGRSFSGNGGCRTDHVAGTPTE